jgi:4-hydroxymandelate oxidase
VDPIDLGDFETLASQTMARHEFEEVASAVEGDLTMRRTRAAWDALALRPRVLPGASDPDLHVEVLGQWIEVPFLLAPAGFHTRAHPDGELATARAAATVGTIMTVSANPGHPVEAVAAETAAPKWLQLYLFREREETIRRVRLAEDAGFVAICLTLDAHWPAKRAGRARRVTSAVRATPGVATTGPDRARHRVTPDPSTTWADPGATWDDVGWFRTLTSLPIVCKGIMTGEDAEACVACGVDGIIVSNHGGRIDNTLATIEVLPEVVDAVGGRAEIFLDGGIRRGADVVKAVALGARAVLLGRPIFWGLAHGGADGLTMLLDILREEVEATMMQCSRPTVGSLDSTLVTRLPPLPPVYSRS